MNHILCVNGSDSMGHSGIQADIRTIRDMGENAYTAVTSVTVQTSTSIMKVQNLPPQLVAEQINAIYEEAHPQAVKIGLINSPEAIREIRKEIVGCKSIVTSPVILSSKGGCLMSNESIKAFSNHLLPISTIVILKCTDAEIMLGCRITRDEEMIEAAHKLRQRGADWVLLRGGTYNEGRINALLMGDNYQSFFSSVNIDGWQRHGVGGALSTAIAVLLARGNEVPAAVSEAHIYMHNQVVYASSKPKSQKALRPNDLYNTFLSLVADNYRTAHDVAYYAQQMSITQRYLSHITSEICGRSPKQVIDSYLLKEAEQMLLTTTLTIQEISNALGFSSQITFTKFFKVKKHISPSGFRGR